MNGGHPTLRPPLPAFSNGTGWNDSPDSLVPADFIRQHAGGNGESSAMGSSAKGKGKVGNGRSESVKREKEDNSDDSGGLNDKQVRKR